MTIEEHVYYIPHYVLVKEESTTTKYRIVFDANAPSSSDLSLNNCLISGPVVQRQMKLVNCVSTSELWTVTLLNKNITLR